MFRHIMSLQRVTINISLFSSWPWHLVSPSKVNIINYVNLMGSVTWPLHCYLKTCQDKDNIKWCSSACVYCGSRFQHLAHASIVCNYSTFNISPWSQKYIHLTFNSLDSFLCSSVHFQVNDKSHFYTRIHSLTLMLRFTLFDFAFIVTVSLYCQPASYDNISKCSISAPPQPSVEVTVVWVATYEAYCAKDQQNYYIMNI